MKLVRAAGAAALLLSSVAFAQTAPPPSITAHATAQVAAPLQIQCSGISFSSLLSGKIASSVVLPPDGSPIIDPGNILLPGAGQDAHASNCSVTGDATTTYNVTLPTSVSLANGSGQTMTVNTFTISSDGDANPLSRVLHNDGRGLGLDTFGVGAKLNVGANQAPGTYSGSYVVNVQYN